MSDYLSERIRLKQLNPDRFDAPRIDEMEISAGENDEGQAVIVALEGRKRKILKPTEDRSTIIYDKVSKEIFFKKTDEKPQFIYFMEFTFDNLVPDAQNQIKKITANVGFIDFVDSHLVFVGQTHTEGQSIKVYYSNWDKDAGYQPEQLLLVSKTDGIGGDNTYVMERPDPEIFTEENVFEDSIVNVKDRDRLRVVVETNDEEGNTVNNPLEYAHIVLKVRINTEDLTSPWARSIFQDFLDKPYSDILSDENKKRVFDYLQEQVIFNRFGPTGAGKTTSDFLFAYEITPENNIDGDHFRIKDTARIQDRTWTINGRSESLPGGTIPHDKLTLGEEDSKFVIITQLEDNVFEDLSHVEQDFTGIIPRIWAKKVVRNFLGASIHLSRQNNISEWTDWAKQDSHRWSDDNQTETPWRFINEITENMIPKQMWEPQSEWGKTESLINAEGYLKTDFEAESDRVFPRRMWGDNAPYIDKLYHRLIGSEKYTTYEDQYQSYEYAKQGDPNWGDFTVTDNTIIKSAYDVKTHYWFKYGYEGLFASNDSTWLYPVWFKDEEPKFSGRLLVYPDIGTHSRDTEGKYFDDVVNNVIDEDLSLFYINPDRISNLPVFPDPGSVNPPEDNGFYKYNFKGDHMCIISINDTNASYMITFGGSREGCARHSPCNVAEYLFTKNYSNVFIRDFIFRYGLPVFRGKFSLLMESYLYSSTFFFNSNQIPLSRLDIGIIQGDMSNLPVTFTNISSDLGTVPVGAPHIRFERTNGNRFYIAHLENCPALESLHFSAHGVKIINCEKLTHFGCSNRRSDAVDVPDGYDPTTTLFQLDTYTADYDINGSTQTGNIIADNINIPYVLDIRLHNASLTQTQVDAVIKAFYKAVIVDDLYRDSETNQIKEGQIRIQRETGRNPDWILNASPSQSVINNEIQALAGAGWTIYHN